MARAVAVSMNVRRGTIAAMLNGISGTPPSEAPANRKPWYRFRPHPASAVAWLFALVLLRYAGSHAPLFPKPGTPITAHYPQVLHYGKALLAAYWLCAAVVLGRGAYRLPFEEPLRDGELWLAVLVAIAALGYGVAYLVPGSEAGRPYEWVPIMGACAGLFAFLAAVYHVSRRNRRSGLVALALSLFAVLPLAFTEMPVLSSAWHDVAQAEARDGRTYHVQLKEAMQAADYALTEETSRSRLFLRTRVVADVGDISSAWPVLVRPGELRWGGREFANSPDGRWLVYATKSYPSEAAYSIRFAYDLRAKRLYRRADRAQLSPFLLIGPDDTLNSRDVEALRSWMAHPYTPDEALTPEVLERDAQHPNPRVREVVRELRAGR
jgi:NADH:ubiquinone oxidoreductase subunit 6 (subunit J)